MYVIEQNIGYMRYARSDLSFTLNLIVRLSIRGLSQQGEGDYLRNKAGILDKVKQKRKRRLVTAFHSSTRQ